MALLRSLPRLVLPMISFEFPLPPTLNHAYGQRRGGGKFIKKDGIAFHREVSDIVAAAGHPTITGRVAVFVAVYPKNNVRQDVANREKLLSDSMTMAGVWEDDSLIDSITIVRRQKVKGGKVRVLVHEMTPDEVAALENDPADYASFIGGCRVNGRHDGPIESPIAAEAIHGDTQAQAHPA